MPKITLRTLADNCGLSASTASRALSGHPNVRREVREKVQAEAQRLGYTRNHLVGAVMAHVRAARAQRFQGTLAIVHVPSSEQPQPRPMQQIMIDAARTRAQELGFQLDLFSLDRGPNGASALSRILRSRGVQGAIFLNSNLTDAVQDFTWQHFASAEIDYGSNVLIQHTIAIDHHLTLNSALTRLRGLGYCRVGLFIERYKDERLLNKWTAAFRSFQESSGGIGDVPLLVATTMTSDVFLDWHREHALDLAIGHVDDAVDWLRNAGVAVPKRTGFFNLNWNERRQPCAGLDLRPELQGIAAVESVVAQIHRNERGLPADPHTVTVSGRWIDGPTLRPTTRAKHSSKTDARPDPAARQPRPSA
ncbi:MAG TPA: LacI family DNA-binding transcriptional regulator [Opitutus sp.]|nr:LacI family DNA-binding transcriptional regulator [Opitutus sp.]